MVEISTMAAWIVKGTGEAQTQKKTPTGPTMYSEVRGYRTLTQRAILKDLESGKQKVFFPGSNFYMDHLEEVPKDEEDPLLTCTKNELQKECARLEISFNKKDTKEKLIKRIRESE
jgi:hypothetical protein